MKTVTKQTVLVVAAHPDDEVLGCGGTIARLVRDGSDVFISILGEGITSRFAKREQIDKKSIRDLECRCHEVSQLLGAQKIFLHGLPDNRFDTVPLLDVVKIIEDVIDREKPDIIYTHHGGDLNIDHTVTHRAVVTATRPIRGHPVKDIYAFEVPSSTEWAFGQFHTGFQPNVFFDISDTLDIKIRAMALYESEVRPPPHPRSPEILSMIAGRWGSVVGLDGAEPFELIRSIK